MHSTEHMPHPTKGTPAKNYASGEDIATLAKALAHPARIRIIHLLLEKKSCIGGDIVDEVGLAQSTVSEHLRILKSSGIITGEITRPRVCYSLNPARLQPLTSLLGLIFDSTQNGDNEASTCWVTPKPRQ